MERSEWFARRRATIAYYSRFGFADCLTLDHTHLYVSFRFIYGTFYAIEVQNTSRVLALIFRTLDVS